LESKRRERTDAFDVQGKGAKYMDRMKEDRSRSKNVTSGTPNRGRANPYTNSKMPLELEETREHEDVEDIEEE
jgi:hypothetical protein